MSCDICNEEFPTDSVEIDLGDWRFAEKAGWLITDHGCFHSAVCPECWKHIAAWYELRKEK
jgi:hypothetical protein